MNHIFLTVDTECHDIERENQYIWGKKKGKEYGIGRILELGKQYGIPINFFVDFAEEKRYGKNFIKSIVDKIKEYQQPVFLHLHPNFISGDEERSFLWQYDINEQAVILQEGVQIYAEIMGKFPTAFRAGRYGVNKDTYEVMNQLMPEILDFSFTGEYGKMCHIDKRIVKTVNHYTKYKNLSLMPNSSFVALDFLGIKKRIGVDISEMSLTEFEEFLMEAKGRDFVLTMHSWNFINKYFWNKTYVGNHRTNERLFKGMIKLARKYNYQFSSIDNYNFPLEGADTDIDYNACSTVWGRIRALFLNFWRFQQMAKVSKKYMIIYSMFYIIVFCVILGIGVKIIL